MPHMLAHGYQVLVQTAAGAGSFPFMVEDSLIGFLEQSSKFLAPVYVGDTLYPTLVIDEITPGRTTGVVGMRTHGAQPEARARDGRAAALSAAEEAGVNPVPTRHPAVSPPAPASRVRGNERSRDRA